MFKSLSNDNLALIYLTPTLIQAYEFTYKSFRESVLTDNVVVT